MANKSQPTYKKSRFTTKNSLMIALPIGLFLVLGGMFISHKVKMEREFKIDRSAFTQTETDVTQTYNTMILQAGAPMETHNIKSCGHVSLKFKTGALYCNVQYDFFYDVDTPEEGRELAQKMISALQSNAFSKDGNEDSISPTTTDSSRGYSFIANGSFNCWYNYDSVSSTVHNSTLNSNVGVNFQKPTAKNTAAEFSFGCGKGTVKPIYPVEK